MSIFKLENLSLLVQSFSPTHCDYLCENCIVALESHKHSPGCKIEVKGEQNKEYILQWNKTFNKGGYKEIKKVTEKAAEAISFFLAHELTDYGVVEESIYGTGIDFWLSYNEDHELYDPSNIFQARLEVSGIYEEKSNNNVNERSDLKKAQVEASDFTKLPVYISIVEIATPKALFIKK